MLSIAIYGLVLVAATALPCEGLPSCSSTQSYPCSCPDGTQYSESVTYSTIGASAKDVEELLNDFYKPDWLGAAPWKTKGPDNTAGVSIRVTEFPTPVGIYNVSEKLTQYKVARDYSFIQRFEQLASTIPQQYHSGNGSFSGYWVTLQGINIFQYETLIRWSVYACETGRARNFARFHEIALNNATKILTAAGKIHGLNGGPWSIQDF